MKNFLAIYIGSDAALERVQWDKMDDVTRKARQASGIKAWMDWATTNSAVIVDHGSPLGKTKRASPDGVTDTKSPLGKGASITPCWVGR